ncbi:MAG: ABC transporter permease [Candidatus Sulfopaludibacter sp.]|nr:ABC transporter permease [Candidatus Sulfopaludibacter sp.]
MSVWRQLVRGLRALIRRQSTDREIAEEVESYLEESRAALSASGLSEQQARRVTQREFGNATSIREQVRSYGWENAIATPLSDLRYAARRLRGNPGFTAISVMTLALGIGASTAIFSVIEGVLLKPLPYPQSEQIVALWHTAPGINIKELNLAVSLYFTYSEESRVFQDVGMWTPDTASITGLAEPEEVPGLAVTNRFLPVLGVQPALGRRFTPADDDPNSPRTVMLSDDYWKSRFGGDRSIIGRRILIDGDAAEIIGVQPPSFQFLDRKISLLMPLRFNRSAVRLISFCCQGVARLKPGVTLTQANADVARMLLLAPLKFPMNPGFSATMFADARIAPTLRPLKELLVGNIGNTLWVLLGTVGIVLLIACANVANLLLVRADGRRQELAIRAALGAGLGRIARGLLMESALLGIAGGALGLALAAVALRILAASNVAPLPRVHEISIDSLAVAFTLAVSLGASLLFGLIPVIKYARPRLSNALRGGGRSLSQSRERHRARSLLVVLQVALAVVLLVASGLMIRTFQALRHVDPGFSGAERVATLRISIPEKQVAGPERAIRMEEDILRRIGDLAGVSAVAIVNVLPMEGGSNNPVYVEDQATREGAIPPIRRYKFTSPGYVAAMGSRLIAGREFTWAETYNRAPVALVSENMAREVWHDPRAALGKRIRSTLKDDWREVIGVVADLRDDGVDQKAPGIVYWPLLVKNFGAADTNVVRSVAFVIRTPRAESPGLLRELAHAVGSVNPNLPVADVKTLGAVYDRSLARTSFTLVLLAIAGGMSLLLGVVGIWGVTSYSVAQRTREIGIRLALGAPVQGVTGIFVRHGLVLSGIGAACGLVAALALTRLMKSLLYEVSPADPVTYVAVSAGLILAATLASYLPARRATRIDQVEALRAE